MSKEKLFLSIIAAILGLVVAGGAFYIYQLTSTVDESKKPNNTIISPAITNTPASSNFLVVNNPKDEEVFTKKIITISGKTNTDALILVSSEDSDQVVKPATNGDFSLTETVGDGTNLLKITAIFKNGEEQTTTRIVTSTTEEF